MFAFLVTKQTIKGTLSYFFKFESDRTVLENVQFAE